MTDENVVFISQDESIFHSKDSDMRTWNLDGVKMRKKGKGKEETEWLKKDEGKGRKSKEREKEETEKNEKKRKEKRTKEGKI